jgi:NADPH:quinone reductase-like Zn-dependent oxidoreductase
MTKGAMVRGIFVGAREHFDALMKAVDVNKLKPVIDKAFDFDAAPEAFRYLKSAQHFGKIVIKI